MTCSLDDAITDWDAAPKETVPNGGGPMTIENGKETMTLGDARCKVTWDSTGKRVNDSRY